MDESFYCGDKNIGPIFICNNIRVENDCNVKNNSFSYYDFQQMNIVSMIQLVKKYYYLLEIKPINLKKLKYLVL